MPEVVIPYKPRNQMLPYHERQQRFAAIVAHRRFGKTTACLNDLQRGALSCKRTAPRFAYIAPLLKQGKDIAWDKLKRIAWPLKQYGAEFNESELRVDYPNGGRVRIYGADNPEAMRGLYLDGAVLDEPAQMHLQATWAEVIRPALADRQGWATFIGTPKGRDAFWKIWRTALGDPVGWYSLMLRASETGILPNAELRALREELGEAAYRREMECSFDEPDEMQFISATSVMAARSRTQAASRGPRLIGVDIARAGSDWNVILFRNGDTVPEDGIVRFRQPDLMQTVGRVAEVVNARKPDAVFVDGAGVGGGVVDRLRQLGFRVVEINAGSSPTQPDRYRNLRAEMWDKMRTWLKDRGSIPHDEPLMDDLSAPQYKYDVSNRLQLESKDDMKSRGVPSPDTGDALSLTFAQPVASADVMQVRWDMVVEEADPFA